MCRGEIVWPVHGGAGYARDLERKAPLRVLETMLSGVVTVPSSCRDLGHGRQKTVGRASSDIEEESGRLFISHSESPQGVFVCLQQGQRILKPRCHSSPDRSGVSSRSIVDLSRDDVRG